MSEDDRVTRLGLDGHGQVAKERNGGDAHQQQDTGQAQCATLAKAAKRAASHLAKRQRYSRRAQEVGTNVFIGHGGSRVWKDLKDFVQDRLALPWDEFNSVPVAGVTNVARLSEMLDDAAIAFLVMTAEDEQADGE